MTNTNIQASVPIGTRLAYRPQGNYQNGELAKAVNVVATSVGTLKNRKSICASPKGALSYIVGSLGFTTEARHDIGVAQIATFNDYYHASPGDFERSNSAVPRPNVPSANAASFHRVVGHVLYRSVFYRVTHSFNADTNEQKFYIWNGVPTGDPAVGASLAFSVTDADTNKYRLVDAYIFKDRLWLLINNTLTYSKATDPLTWTVPEGGFIKLAETAYSVSVTSDTQYLFTLYNTYSFTYSIDPGDDGYLRSIFERGATTSCVHKGVVFSADTNNIYQIMGSNVDTVLALEDVYNTDLMGLKRIKMVSFEDEIFILRYTQSPEGYRHNLEATDDQVADDLLLVINPQNNSISTIKFEDRSNGFVGRVSDITTTGMTNSEWALMLEVTHFTGAQYRSQYYYMWDKEEKASSDAGGAGIDKVNIDYAPISTYQEINVVIDSYTPDGDRYLIKKFRHLSGTGSFAPFDNKAAAYSLSVGYNDSPFKPEQNMNNIANVFNKGVNPLRPPFGFRYPMNQRARKISFRFRTWPVALFKPLVVDDKNKGVFELVDLRVWWTYTQRALETRNNSS